MKILYPMLNQEEAIKLKKKIMMKSLVDYFGLVTKQ